MPSAGTDLYVIDANTVVSAALNPTGIPRRAMIAARGAGVVALSAAVHAEIAEVLRRPKFARVLTTDRQEEILQLLSAAAVWFDPPPLITDCRDPKDNRYLDLALAAKAMAIISGDQDLLVLNPWRGIAVLRPAEFLEHLGG